MQDMRDYVVGLYKSGAAQGVCPVCGGGRGKEVSFGAFEVDNNTLGYKCHRSSCACSGRVTVIGGAPPRVNISKARTLDLVAPSPDDEQAYLDQFGLTHGPTVCRFKGRHWFVATLRRHDGTRFGWQRRIIRRDELEKGESKSFTHKDERYPLTFYRPSPFNTTLIIVEDPWSAMRIEQRPSLQCDSAAMCGGDWTEVMAREVAGKYKTVLLVPDRDAQVAAIKAAFRWASIQPVAVRVPRVDLKNMEDDEIIHTLKLPRGDYGKPATTRDVT